MFEREERKALAMLVCVVAVVLVAHLLLDTVARPLVASPYSERVPEGALVLLEGRIEAIATTESGGHLLLTVNGTPVFLPQGAAAQLDLHENDSVLLYGVVQTYRGKREVAVASPADVRIRG
jgi:hypothetical protein